MSHPMIQKHPRYRFQAPVDVVSGAQVQRLGMENISLGGIFISTPAPEPPGSLIQVRLPMVPVRLGLLGRVVHVMGGDASPSMSRRSGMGVQFDQLSEHSLGRLQIFVDRLAAQAREETKRGGAWIVDKSTVHVRDDRESLCALWAQGLKHGGLMAAGEAPPLGSMVKVVIGPLVLIGEVVHVQPDGAGIALRDLDGERREALQRFLEGATLRIVYQDPAVQPGPPLGKVLAVARHLFGAIERDDLFGALGLPIAATEPDVRARVAALKRLFSTKPFGATPPQQARVDAALRAVIRMVAVALRRLSALRSRAQLARVGEAPHQTTDEQARALLAEGIAFDAAGQRQDAKRVLCRALELAPADEAIKKRLASVNAVIDLARAADLLGSAEVFVQGVGMKEDAIKHAREAVRLSTAREIQLRALRVLAKSGQYEDAQLLAQDLLERDASDVLALQALLAIYERTQQWGKAVQAGETLLRLRPTDSELAKRLKKILTHVRR